MGSPAYFEIVLSRSFGMGFNINFSWTDSVYLALYLPFVVICFTYEKNNYQKPFCFSGWWAQ